MQRLREIAYKYEIILLVIHHTQKIDNKALSMASMAGSRVISQELDFMIGVNRLSDGSRYLKDIAYRYANEDNELVLTFNINESQFVEAGRYCTEQELLIKTTPFQLNGNDTKILNYF